MISGRFASSEAVFEYFMGFVNVERGQATEFKLDRMRALASALGDPQLGRLTVHVAGSKGKGSVSTMIAGILEASGLRTGLYTSPHLMHWKERLTLTVEEMPESTILEAMDMILPLVEGKGPGDFPGGEAPTFFELTTLLSFCAFRLSGCRAQVIETGLGGRLDSTNIVDPDISVITPIELEHTQYLGDTIALIAGEKAGIIKPGKPVCISAQKPEAAEVFAETASRRGCALFAVPDCIAIEDIAVSPEGTRARLRALSGAPESTARLLRDGMDVSSPMIGKVQASNMALAVLAASTLLPSLSREALRSGLETARQPARFELFPGLLGLPGAPGFPPVVLDGAHTPDSVQLAADSFTALFPGPKVLLFACAQDKKHAEMAAILAPHFDATIVTKPGTFKQSEPEKAFESFRRQTPHARLVPDTGTAIREALALAESRGAALLVTGSFYLCAEARPSLEARSSCPGATTRTAGSGSRR
ncbi:MAG: Mur ligase family protein [Rectinemataceae bacterium]